MELNEIAANKALKYLEGKPFRVQYIEGDIDNNPTPRPVILTEEYPDYIPDKEEIFVISESKESFICTLKVYYHDKNTLCVIVVPIRIYEEQKRRRGKL